METSAESKILERKGGKETRGQMTGEARRTRTGIKEEVRKGNRPEPRI